MSPKLIDEYIGRLNSNHESVSIAHMRARRVGRSPGKRLSLTNSRGFEKCAEGGTCRRHNGRARGQTCAGQATIAHKDEWVRYSSPVRKARILSLYAYRPFQWKRCIGTRRDLLP